jgi:hypothetical protein
MSKTQDIAELRAKAAKYRAIARQTVGQEKTAREILLLAAQFELRAREMEQGE